jgi:SHS2 domain-containing protein
MHEVFDHTADIGLRIRASSLEELFREAGIGLFELIVGDLRQVRSVQEIKIDLPFSSGEYDYLLFDWLNELLFQFDSHRLLLCDFNVRLESKRLQAIARGEQLEPARHHLEHEVKAITYHELKVTQESAGGWLAEVIVDI